VGVSHQAKLPVCRERSSTLFKENDEVDEKDFEELLWKADFIDSNKLLNYLHAARSIAGFAGICERGSADDMYEMTQSDSTTISALEVLHKMNYDTDHALEHLAFNPSSMMKHPCYNWSDEEKVSNNLNFFSFKNYLFI
jgi:arginine-glutamic acid dipeptide repeats protein